MLLFSVFEVGAYGSADLLLNNSTAGVTQPLPFLPPQPFSKFKSLSSNVNLDELNTARTPSAIKSENLVFTEVDSNDDNLFNEILWKGIKGEDAILPAPRRVAFVFNSGNKKD